MGMQGVAPSQSHQLYIDLNDEMKRNAVELI